MSLRVIAIVVALFVASQYREARAYPQFQLARDQTCTGCHISPAGGGLLNENGGNVAESISKLGHDPEFLYGKWAPPAWLTLGGDFRALGGVFRTPFVSAAAFPMQMEIYAQAKLPKGFFVHVTGGGRPREEGFEAATTVWSREHYVMWRQKPEENEGLYVRVGRFMPVFGLRVAEHPSYVRRFGGTPLFSDTYGAAVEYIDPKFEVHATGFIRDRLIDPAVHDSGGALYGEYRITDKISVGLEGMATASKDDKKYRAGFTAKTYVEPADVLVQTEWIFTNQDIDDSIAVKKLTGLVMASRFMTNWLLFDLGIGVHDGDLAVKANDRMGFDLNIHMFVDSHFELVLNNRYEQLGFGAGGDWGGYWLLQAHYRL